MSLVKGKNIDTNAITFSVPKSLDNGAKLVYVNYNLGRFSVQTPWMTMPWKLGAYTDGDYPKYSIDLSFKGMDENPDLKGFHDKFKGLGCAADIGRKAAFIAHVGVVAGVAEAFFEGVKDF